ncbi:MAG: hypothetical protein ACR2K1_04920 [Saprospiraceae bacterium]
MARHKGILYFFSQFFFERAVYFPGFPFEAVYLESFGGGIQQLQKAGFAGIVPPDNNVYRGNIRAYQIFMGHKMHDCDVFDHAIKCF